MKKIMIYAYTAFNLGDDLFIKILCERYPETKFILYAPRKYKVLFNNIKNLKIYASDSLIVKGINYVFRLFNIKGFYRSLIAQKCDAGVYIGGSLFMQDEDWREGLKNVKRMRIRNRPFYLLGANFGPFQDKDFYIEYKSIFKEFTDICFREKYSYDMFNDLLNVRMADDIVFQLNQKDVDKTKKSLVISVIKPSFRKHLRDYDDIYYEKIKDITVYFIDKGYEVTLISFCEYQGDAEAVERIMDLIPKDYTNLVSSYLYKLNIDEVLSVISQSSFIIATRFHSMVLGWVYNKPVFPFVYSGKMTNVMKEIGFSGGYTDFENINSLNPKEVFGCIDTNLIDVSMQKDNAEKHFEKLDEYLQ